MLIKKIIIGTFVLLFSISSFAGIKDTTLTGELDQYQAIRIAEVLGSATKDDTVVIAVDSGGGFTSLRDFIIVAMKKTEAKTVVIVRKLAASSAASIMLNADLIGLYPTALVGFHLGGLNLSTKSGGRLPTYEQFANNSLNHLKKLGLDRVFTEKDWQNIKEGKTVWLTGYELNKRDPARFRLIE